MKTMHCVYDKGRFADSYTSDLEGFMNNLEFLKIMNTFNSLAEKYPPFFPVTVNTCVVCFTLFVLVTIMVVVRYTNQVGIIVIVPAVFSIISILIVIWRREKQKNFEREIIKLCSCMNATENVRGINFKLNFLTPEQHVSSDPTSIYAITIEFDDRYNLLHYMSRPKSSPPPYSSFPMQVPVNVYCPKQSKQ